MNVTEDDNRRYVVIRREPEKPALTSREREVVVLASRGLALKTIAAELGTTMQTVHGQLQAALEKLGLRDRIELHDLVGVRRNG